MCSATDRRRGQATVEAAFALPILMVLVLLLVQPGIVLYDRIAMQSAAAEGCRLLATTGSDAQVCEDFIRRRLSAVPQTEIFHVHSSGCSWDIAFEGSEASGTVKVSIANEVRPLPLLDAGAALLGLTNDAGNLEVRVECEQQMQPDWALSSLGGAAAGQMAGAWCQ